MNMIDTIDRKLLIGIKVFLNNFDIISDNFWFGTTN